MKNERLYDKKEICIIDTICLGFIIAFFIFNCIFVSNKLSDYLFNLSIILLGTIWLFLSWLYCLNCYIEITNLEIIRVRFKKKNTIPRSQIKHIALIKITARWSVSMYIIYPANYPDTKIFNHIKGSDLREVYKDKELIIFYESKRIKKVLKEHGYAVSLKNFS